jgi:hypothetical protein
MMRRGLLAVFLPFLLASPTILWAQDKIGEAVYLEGDVSLVRNGASLDPSAITIGISIDNYDFMKTGDDGNAQIKVSSPRVSSSTVTVSPDTQFTFELSALDSRQQSSFNLINGSLALKVSALSKAQDLDVQTESTAMGVRGTEFAVSTSVSGDVLVTCSTGEVVCTAENGTEYRAVPGTVIENRAEGTFRQIPVSASDLEGFRRSWAAERMEAAKKNALSLIQDNARRYQELRASYDRDYAALMRQRSVISKWSAEDNQGGTGSPAEVEREKGSIAATMARLRRTQFMLERSYYRLLRLKSFHDQGYGHGTISGSLSTEQFFNQLQREGRDVEGHMATVRNVTRLYARRNNGVDPTNYSLRFRPGGLARQSSRQTSGPQAINPVGRRVNAAGTPVSRVEQPGVRQTQTLPRSQESALKSKGSPKKPEPTRSVDKSKKIKKPENEDEGKQ